VSVDNLLSTVDVGSAQEEVFPWDASPMFDTTERISYAGTQSGWDGSDDSYQPGTFDSVEFGQPAASSSYSSFVSSGGDSAGRFSTDFSLSELSVHQQMGLPGRFYAQFVRNIKRQFVIRQHRSDSSSVDNTNSNSSP
jgi:hypothetical protein